MTTPIAGNPVYVSEILKAIRASSERPIVRCLATGVQSIPDGVPTALQFGAEDWDTHGFHDPVTNNTRITPTVAGYYRFYGTYYTGPLTTYLNVDVSVRKNGTISLPPANRKAFAIGASQQAMALSVECTVQVFCNGTTDYVELIAFQDNSASAAVNTNQSARFSSCFEGEFLRY